MANRGIPSPSSALFLCRSRQSVTNALWKAVKKGQLKQARYALSNGGDPETPDPTGALMLHFVAANGNLEHETSRALLDLLLQSHRCHIDRKDGRGNTAAHLLAQRDQFLLLQVLVNHGADLTLVNAEGHTAFHLAAAFASVPVVRLLLPRAMRLDLTYRAAGVQSPLAMAVANHNAAVAYLLLRVETWLGRVSWCSTAAAIRASLAADDHSNESLLIQALLDELGPENSRLSTEEETHEDGTPLDMGAIVESVLNSSEARFVEVTRTAGQPFGFSLYGGIDVNVRPTVLLGSDPCTIQSGTMETGDELRSINDQIVTGFDHNELVAAVGQSGNTVRLALVPRASPLAPVRRASVMMLAVPDVSEELKELILQRMAYSHVVTTAPGFSDARDVHSITAAQFAYLRSTHYIDPLPSPPHALGSIGIVRRPTHPQITEMHFEHSIIDILSLGPNDPGFQLRGGLDQRLLPLFSDVVCLMKVHTSNRWVALGDALLAVNGCNVAGLPLSGVTAVIQACLRKSADLRLLVLHRERCPMSLDLLKTLRLFSALSTPTTPAPPMTLPPPHSGPPSAISFPARLLSRSLRASTTSATATRSSNSSTNASQPSTQQPSNQQPTSASSSPSTPARARSTVSSTSSVSPPGLTSPGACDVNFANALANDIRNSILTATTPYITRAPRPEEEDGLTYHFVSQSVFDAAVARDEFFEWRSAGGVSYGTKWVPERAMDTALRSRCLEVVDTLTVVGQAHAFPLAPVPLLRINPDHSPDTHTPHRPSMGASASVGVSVNVGVPGRGSSGSGDEVLTPCPSPLAPLTLPASTSPAAVSVSGTLPSPALSRRALAMPPLHLSSASAAAGTPVQVSSISLLTSPLSSSHRDASCASYQHQQHLLVPFPQIPTRESLLLHLKSLVIAHILALKSEEFTELNRITDTDHPRVSQAFDSLNRFSDAVPYNHNRVVLAPMDQEHSYDYINASVLRVRAPKDTIASQGPLEHTVFDFWRMVWQLKSNIVVMLTDRIEDHEVKCVKYWAEPRDGAVFYHLFSVRCSAIERAGDCIHRTLTLTNEQCPDQTRVIHHLQIPTWRDHNVSSENTILALRAAVLTLGGAQPSPVVVHCSAGVGRTGCYIAADQLVSAIETALADPLRVDSAQAQHLVDVFNCVKELRSERPLMVQTFAQYKLVFTTLLKWLWLQLNAMAQIEAVTVSTV